MRLGRATPGARAWNAAAAGRTRRMGRQLGRARFSKRSKARRRRPGGASNEWCSAMSCFISSSTVLAVSSARRFSASAAQRQRVSLRGPGARCGAARAPASRPAASWAARSARAPVLVPSSQKPSCAHTRGPVISVPPACATPAACGGGHGTDLERREERAERGVLGGRLKRQQRVDKRGHALRPLTPEHPHAPAGVATEPALAPFSSWPVSEMDAQFVRKTECPDLKTKELRAVPGACRASTEKAGLADYLYHLALTLSGAGFRRFWPPLAQKRHAGTKAHHGVREAAGVCAVSPC